MVPYGASVVIRFCLEYHISEFFWHRTKQKDKLHVPTYNSWMKDPFLLETTASEPLSIEEEYNMQKKWTDDENKCIFIILAKDECSGLYDIHNMDMDD